MNKPTPIHIEVQPTSSLPDGRNLVSDNRMVVTIRCGDDEFVYVHEAEKEHGGTPGEAAQEAWHAFMSMYQWEVEDEIRREDREAGIFDDV